jgi:PEP-CTERM motif
MKQILSFAALSLISFSAWAGAPTPVPEPATLALMGAGALGIYLSNKRKK